MEIHVDEALNITPKGAEAYTAAILGPQALGDESPPKRIGLGFECPDCDEKAAIEIGTPYSHKC